MKTALLVHGLLRGPMSMAPLSRMLHRNGYRTVYFYYSSTFESLDRIVSRLRKKMELHQPDIIIGHSLGGILSRLALTSYSPKHLFTLGTPHRSSKIARYFWAWWLFRVFTGQSGQLLSDQEKCDNLPKANYPITTFAGTKATFATRFIFGNEPNDGLVAVSEAGIGPTDNVIKVHTAHTFLSFSAEIQAKIEQHLRTILHISL